MDRKMVRDLNGRRGGTRKGGGSTQTMASARVDSNNGGAGFSSAMRGAEEPLERRRAGQATPASWTQSLGGATMVG
jgi:hypothetical protein